MIGDLPKTISIDDVAYSIRTDFRDILRIVSAFNADELSSQEKVLICLRQLYTSPEEIPEEKLAEAFDAAVRFIECANTAQEEDRKKPVLVDWEKDEQMLFAAVNKTAGFEVRAVPYLHWWTFLGYFQSIDSEDLWGQVLTIRQKKARHKPLEKWEQEFFNANRDLCTVGKLKSTKDVRESSYRALEDFYNELHEEEEE